MGGDEAIAKAVENENAAIANDSKRGRYVPLAIVGGPLPRGRNDNARLSHHKAFTTTSALEDGRKPPASDSMASVRE